MLINKDSDPVYETVQISDSVIQVAGRFLRKFMFFYYECFLFILMIHCHLGLNNRGF